MTRIARARTVADRLIDAAAGLAGHGERNALAVNAFKRDAGQTRARTDGAFAVGITAAPCRLAAGANTDAISNTGFQAACGRVSAIVAASVRAGRLAECATVGHGWRSCHTGVTLSNVWLVARAQCVRLCTPKATIDSSRTVGQEWLCWASCDVSSAPAHSAADTVIHP